MSRAGRRGESPAVDSEQRRELFHSQPKSQMHPQQRQASYACSASAQKANAMPSPPETQSHKAEWALNSSSGVRATQREEDEHLYGVSPSDVLTTGGSASSLSSASSSVFSTNHASRYNMNTLTPLTHTESSPPRKMLSPRSQKRSYEQMQNGTTTSPYLAPAANSRAVSEAMTPVQTPPEPSLQARPGPGDITVVKRLYDPELDEKLEVRERRRFKPTYRTFTFENQGAASSDPRLGIAGYSEGLYHMEPAKSMNKAVVRPLLKNINPYSRDQNTIGPGRATKIVVTGFSVLTAESKLRSLLGSFGDLVECTNHIDPTSGAPLGICSARYKDRTGSRKGEVPLKGADAAAQAEREASGTRIDGVAIKIELDREGQKCKRYMNRKLEAKRKQQEMLKKEEERKRPAPQAIPTGPALAPPNAPKAPKGPSGRQQPMAPPAGPFKRHASVLAPPASAVPVSTPSSHHTHAAQSLVDTEPLQPKMKKTPYLFLSHIHVPVLGTTIAHLKKRLRSYDWIEVKCDRTGYFVTFENSRHGKVECKRTFEECQNFPLFTYTMNFECYENGNPNYVRSPSPERVAQAKRERDTKIRIRREDELDFEAEKRERAENLDPVRAALELLLPELKGTILKEIKAKVALPHIFDCLHPDKHKEKRAELGLPDPREVDAAKPALPTANLLSTYGTVQNRQKLLNKKPFGKFTKQRPDRREELRQSINVYDERRKRPVQARSARPIVPLHRRLQEFKDEDDSDDERQTTITRDSEGPDSGAISEIGASPAQFDLEDDGVRTPKSKRRRVEAWGGDSDDERQEAVARKALGHLIDKEPEDMAMGELQQVLTTFPRSSEIRQRAAAEIKLRHKAKQDDKLFGIVAEPEPVSTPVETIEDVEMLDVPTVKPKKKSAVAKPKKKTKKEILAEQEAAKAEAKAEEDAIKTLEEEEAVTPAVEEEEEEPRAEVEWAVSEEAPRRTVEDDPNLLLDIDGWQNILKDDEDMRFLQEALQPHKASKILDPRLWAWKQKEFKALNAGGAKAAPKIEGYYVPNSTGSARTEGYKKIAQPEKSKYLPHRIRVQKAREERERQAKNDPQKAAEAAKAAAAAKIVSTASSRSNRANNRRLVNEITISKIAIGADTEALKFNQLKKRKKLVRFDRSAIHNWGLYAEENIAAQDMIIEYVGEKVRQRVADLREINYQKQGIGSSYLFRIDEDTVVDATKKGGIARFINHSCMPNCTAKIIKVDGTKRIVIYALRDIAKNEELTYDYKFEREINSDDRIPCLCGSVGCKGFLN